MTAANAYGMVDGSPQEFCNDEQPHDPHEYLVGMRRFQCPGLPFGGPTVANMNERGAGSGASPECASNSDSRADHLSSATPPASHAAIVQPKVGEKWMTPDGILWRVIDVWPQKVRLHTLREYGVMTATASRVRFVKEARRVSG